VQEVLAGIRRTHGKPPVKKTALTADLVRSMLKPIADDLIFVMNFVTRRVWGAPFG
jgi:hypothetical protein